MTTSKTLSNGINLQSSCCNRGGMGSNKDRMFYKIHGSQNHGFGLVYIVFYNHSRNSILQHKINYSKTKVYTKVKL